MYMQLLQKYVAFVYVNRHISLYISYLIFIYICYSLLYSIYLERFLLFILSDIFVWEGRRVYFSMVVYLQVCVFVSYFMGSQFYVLDFRAVSWCLCCVLWQTGESVSGSMINDYCSAGCGYVMPPQLFPSPNQIALFP